MNNDKRMTFDEDAALYDRWRPTYPAALYEDIFRFAEIKPVSNTLEVGIGTGQATEPILKEGCRVTAIEPGENLVRFVREKYREYGNLTVINSFFEDYECEEGSFDLLYSATAFHWVPPEVGYPKALRLLRSGGSLAVFWNKPNVHRVEDPLHCEIQKLYDRYMPGSEKPRENDTERYEQIKGQIRDAGFEQVDLKLYHSTRQFTAEEYPQLLDTYSDHRNLPPESKEPLYDGIQNAIQKHGGRLTIYDTVELFIAKKP